MKKYLLLSFLVGSTILYAGEGKITADIQMMNGKAGEYVYNSLGYGDTISYLEWKIKNVPLLRLGYDYSINNWEFSIHGKKNIKNNFKSGTMKDSDWVPYFRAEDVANLSQEEIAAIEEEFGFIPTETDRGKLYSFSESKNYVKNIIGLDVSAKYYLKKTDKFKFAPLVGINYDKYEFYAVGGTAYSYIPGLTPQSYAFENTKVISYKQRYLTPYIGVYGSYLLNDKLEFEFGLKASWWGKAKAHDRHHLRGANQTSEKYKDIKYLSTNISAKYHWNEVLTFKTSVEFTKYFKNKKSTVQQIYDNGNSENLNNLHGLENKNISYSIGFEYKF